MTNALPPEPVAPREIIRDGRPCPEDSGWELPWEDFPAGRQQWEADRLAEVL